jgi:hypothetical protein
MKKEQQRIAGLLLSPAVKESPARRRQAEQAYAQLVTEQLQRWQKDGDYFQPVPTTQALSNPPPPSTVLQASHQEQLEGRAAAKLKLARTLAGEGLHEDAREYLEQIVAKFSGTSAAIEARRLLDSNVALRDFGKER